MAEQEISMEEQNTWDHKKESVPLAQANRRF
jgi:hypothetical protein